MTGMWIPASMYAYVNDNGDAVALDPAAAVDEPLVERRSVDDVLFHSWARWMMSPEYHAIVGADDSQAVTACALTLPAVMLIIFSGAHISHRDRCAMCECALSAPAAQAP